MGTQSVIPTDKDRDFHIQLNDMLIATFGIQLNQMLMNTVVKYAAEERTALDE